MKVIEYIAEVLPNGSRALPDNIRRVLGSQTQGKVTLPVETAAMPDPQKGWQIFKALGEDAVAGKLPDTLTKHDEYLYGTRK